LDEPKNDSVLADQPVQIDEKDFPKPEDPGQVLQSSRRANLVTTMVLVILLVFGVLLIVGLANKYNWLPRFVRLRGQKDSITLISSNLVGSDPTVVMVVRRNGHPEVRVLHANTGAVDFLSNSTVESFAPVRSPTGNQVAYFAENAEGQISVVVGAPSQVVTDTISTDTLKDINRSGFEPCDYAQIVWSTDGEKIATFVCNKQSKESYLVVTEVGGTNEILEKTRDNLDRVRSVAWISPTHVVYTQNENNLDVVYLQDIFNPSKPIRLFGP
jgi:hypothetical protein